MSYGSEVAHQWAQRCFGKDHVSNLPIRALRTAEEVIELAQALEVPKDKLHKLVDIVYSRPKGEELKEIGGVLLTLHVLCEELNVDAEGLFSRELERVLSKPESHFKKRNQEKLALGLTA